MESINEIDDIWGNLRALSDVCENSISKISQNMDLRLNTPTFILESEFKKYPHNLRIGHLNTISIPKHREELQRIVPMFDIFGASETFIENGTPHHFSTSKVINFMAKIGRTQPLEVLVFILMNKSLRNASMLNLIYLSLRWFLQSVVLEKLLFW